jgi:hypothetical protein
VLAARRSLALSSRSKRRDLVKATLKTIEIASSREALLAMTIEREIMTQALQGIRIIEIIESFEPRAMAPPERASLNSSR